MVYRMVFDVDGGCRNNGSAQPIAAAACIRRARWRSSYMTRHLPFHPTPTNQRAELTAIIMALEWALEVYEGLNGAPYIRVTIRTDSKYVVGCMTEWIYKWRDNGWVNARGVAVANYDLIIRAADLEDELTDLGSVRYEWIPRSENEEADEYCNDALDDFY